MNRSAIENELRDRMRMQHKAPNTTKRYVGWVNRYLDFCQHQQIGRETKAEKAVAQFLTHLAKRANVAAGTQNQALQAICYWYREVLGRKLVDVNALRAKRPQRTRQVCDQSELALIFAELRGPSLLACRMMYGCGLRIGELGMIRMKDIDFNRKQIHIFGAKGAKDRKVQFPEVLHDAVRRQMESTKVLWRSDVENGMNGVSLPHALGRKSPSSHLEFAWYYLFVSGNLSRCPTSGRLLRHHRDVGGFAKALRAAVRKAGIPKRITAHCLRHSHATHFLEQGGAIHDLKELFGHVSIETTQTYAHVRKDGVTAAKSPLTSLEAMLTEPPAREPEPLDEPFKLRVVG